MNPDLKQDATSVHALEKAAKNTAQRPRESGTLFAMTVIVAVLVITSTFQTGWGQSSSPAGWTQKIVAGFNVTQSQYSNWSEGGTNALAYTLSLLADVTYESDRYRFASSGKFVFGQTKQEGEEVRKAADELRVDLSLTRKIGIKIDPYLSVTARSQFAKGYDYSKKPKVLRSDLFNPLYIVESAGFAYEPQTGEAVSELLWRFGLALKQTGVTQSRFAAIYTDDVTTAEQVEKWRFETGLESTFAAKVQLSSNLSYRTRLGLFTSFENLHTVDMNWESTITAKVAKYVNVNLDVVLFYDEDISTRTQVKEVLSIGLAYTFP
jgi:transcriptional regulator with XRE-family HTH domain